MQISAEQIRGARAMLNWSREDLASACQLAANTIRNLEDGNISPRDDTTRVICDAFERKGLEFIPDGIKKRRKEILQCDGQDGHLALYTNLMQTVISGQGGSVLAVAQSPKEFFDIFCNNHEWLRRIDDFATVRCLVKNETVTEAGSYKKIAFRAIASDLDNRLPGCLIYDKKFVMVRAIGRGYQFTIINDSEMAYYHKALFNAAWKKTDAA